jgi:hypothetical protein
MGGPETYAQLEKWRKRPPSRGGPPAWIPKASDQMGTDVAAILSQIDIPPSRWRNVEIAFLPGGGAVVTVTPKRGYDRTVLLPDRGAVSELGRLLRHPVAMATTPAERKRLEKEWRRREGDGIHVDTPVSSDLARARAA